jgi:hypothetical protein
VNLFRALDAPVSLCLVTLPVTACDVDRDCGSGGTCIKQEKRARGVCFDRNLSAAPTTTETPIEFDPFSPPYQKPAEAGMVPRECAAGMKCVIASIWGKCNVV